MTASHRCSDSDERKKSQVTLQQSNNVDTAKQTSPRHDIKVPTSELNNNNHPVKMKWPLAPS